MCGDLGPLDDVLHKSGELGVFWTAGAGTGSGCRGGGATHGIVYSFDDTVYKIFDEGTVDLEADEFEEGW